MRSPSICTRTALPGGIRPSGAPTTGGGADAPGLADAGGDADGAADPDAGTDADGLADGDSCPTSSGSRKMRPSRKPRTTATITMSPTASTGRPLRGGVRAARYALMYADY